MKQISTFSVCGYTYLITNKKLGIDRIEAGKFPGAMYAYDADPHLLYVWKNKKAYRLIQEDDAIRSLAE